MSDELDEVDRRFIADMALKDRSPEHESFGTVEIARFLTDPEAELSAAQSGRLFADRALRQAYLHLRRAMSSHEVPAVIAASDGEVNEREFDGGRIDLIAGSRAGEWYLRIAITGIAPPQNAMLVLERAQSGVFKLPLSNPDSAGGFLVLIDTHDARQAAILAALRDPLSTGSILSVR